MNTASNNHTTPSLLRPRLRHLSFVALGLALAGGVVAFTTIHGSTAEEQAQLAPPPPKVTVAPVEERLVTDYEEFTGRVDATETVELRARVSGHLEKVHFSAGQLVKQGDLLFTVDARWYRAQFDLASARAQVAEKEAKRSEQLLASSVISAEEADARRATAAQTAAELESARLDLEHTEVRSPITGRISRAYVTSGNLVAGSPGSATLLATIVSTGEAYVYADVDESTVLKFNRLMREGRIVTVGGRVPVELELSDEAGYPRKGFVESTDNRLDASTGSLMLRLVFPNQDGALVPGMFARVRLPVGAPQPTLLVHEQAIGTDQNQKFVLAVSGDHKAVYRGIELGGSAGDGQRVVRSGLRKGDQVIVNGLQRVRPGMTVEPQMAIASLPKLDEAASLSLAAR